MAFEDLKDIALPELDLFDRIAEQLLTQFEEHQSIFYFIKFEKRDNNLIAIEWIREFEDFEDLWEFHWSSEYQRVSAMLRFDESGVYVTIFFGFEGILDHVIARDKIAKRRYTPETGIDESQKLIRLPPDLEKGFAEICGELTLQTSSKTVGSV